MVRGYGSKSSITQPTLRTARAGVERVSRLRERGLIIKKAASATRIPIKAPLKNENMLSNLSYI